MTSPNWNLLYANGPMGGFQNALAQGYSLGTDMRQRREEGDRRNALADVVRAQAGGAAPAGAQAALPPYLAGGGGLVATPEQQAEQAAMEARFPNAPRYGAEAQGGGLSPEEARLIEIDPVLGQQMIAQRRQQAEAQRAAQLETQVGEWTVAAMNGDQSARDNLMRFSFSRWQQLDERQQETIASQQEQRGQAALFALNSPNPRQQVQAYVTATGDQEAASLLQMPDDQLRAALQSQVFQSGLVNELISNQRPDYRVVPVDADMVNVRNPEAVNQFAANRGAAPAAALPPLPQGFVLEGDAGGNVSGGF